MVGASCSSPPTMATDCRVEIDAPSQFETLNHSGSFSYCGLTFLILPSLKDNLLNHEPPDSAGLQN